MRSSGRGLNVADESFYLLSYRWWDVNYRNFTGAQYFYGPVFDLLGHDIAGLRLFRLGTIVVVHLVFGWSFMRWLRTHRPTTPPTRMWEAAGIAAIVQPGGSVRYAEVIAAAEAANVTMYFTGVRHFAH